MRPSNSRLAPASGRRRCARRRSSLVWVFPVYWMVNSSLLPNAVLQSVHPDLPALRRLVRQLHGGLRRRHVLRRARHQRCVTLTTVAVCAVRRLPRRAGDQPLQVPRPQVLRPGGADHPDAAGRGPVHRPVQDDGSRRPAEHRASASDAPLHRRRRAVHDLDAARLRRRRPGRARGGRHGRRPQPHPGVHAHHLPAAGPGPGRLRRLRVPAGLERVHRRARAAAGGGRPDAAAVAARLRAGQRHPRDRLGPGHGGVHPRRRAGDHLLPDRAGPDDLAASSAGR